MSFLWKYDNVVFCVDCFVWRLLCSCAVSLLCKSGSCLLLCLNLSKSCANRFNTEFSASLTSMLSASRQIATRRLSCLLASGNVGRDISLRKQHRFRSPTCLACCAPTRRARPHRTSRLSSRNSTMYVSEQSVVVCTADFKVHPDARMS